MKTSISFKTGQKQKCFINIVHTDRLDDIQLIKADGGGQQAAGLGYGFFNIFHIYLGFNHGTIYSM